MKVLHMLPTRSMEYGGPVEVAEQMVNELGRLGVDASLFPKDRDIRTNLFSTTGRESLLQAVRTNDIIHIHGLWNFPATYTAHAAQRHRVPYVITPHGMLDRWALKQSRLKKRIYALLFEQRNLRNASLLHFLNNEEMVEAREFASYAKTLVLSNGVRMDQLRPLPEHISFLERHPECADRTIVLFLGRLHPKKGFDLLLPAFTKALQKVPRLHLIIAGPDKEGYRQKIERDAIQLGISNRITYTGMVEGTAKQELLAVSDFFVLTSHQEGDSVAVKEAMAAHLPVIITDSCHFNEVEDEGAGFVVSHSPENISQAIETLALAENQKEMGRNAAKIIKERYTWPMIASRLAKAYEQLLGQSR